MFNINNFRNYIDKDILDRGRVYFLKNKVRRMTYDDGYVMADVLGSEKYTAGFELNEQGDIVYYSCDCPYYFQNEEVCKHIAAALFAYEKVTEGERDDSDIRGLMEAYEKAAEVFGGELDGGETPQDERVRIVPELVSGRGELRVSLKIGRERLYKVKKIIKLYSDFKEGNEVRYGKSLDFIHRTELLDEKSRRLLEMAFRSSSAESYYTREDDSAPLDNIIFDEFFEMYKGETLLFEGREFRVKSADPQVEFVLGKNAGNADEPDGGKKSRRKKSAKGKTSSEKNGKGGFMLTVKGEHLIYGMGLKSVFINREKETVYLPSRGFTGAVGMLYARTLKKGGLVIPKKDMPEFYSAVIKKAAKYAEFSGLEMIEGFIPPELSVQLYIDCGDNGDTVFGRLMFGYGDSFYPAYGGGDAPHYDRAGEILAVKKAEKYFMPVLGDDHHPLRAAGDEMIYELITRGMGELSAEMEVYVSDRFQRIVVRPPVRPKVSVGVRRGGLLEINVEDSGYTAEELAEVLKAYKTGAKFHRLKDGSFALPGEALGELNEVMNNLDIDVKDILKKNIKIPAYRMLYLDSLGNGGEVKMKYSGEFKEAVKRYREDAGRGEVPESLKGVMRGYQEEGFGWLSALCGYGFGGILADDMGLGKTVQAIALMLKEKERSAEHKTNLIVCPSSLTLNWESEIKRFAPGLKSLVVIGTAAAREKLIGSIDEGGYDAVITSYSALTRDIDKYEDREFHIQFADEAQYIKNHTTQSAKAVKGIKSGHRFALTGTPVENSLAELWSIFDFIMPGYLFGYGRFRKNFETPISSKNDERAEAALRKNVSPFILRRMKKDVLEELPEKTETVLTSVMEGEQKKLYAASAAGVKKSVKEGLGDSPKDKIQILAMLTRLRQICCDPALVYENYKGGSAKLEQCMELVESCVNSGHKLLLFSQFTSMLDIIRGRLEKAGISYYLLTGETKARERIRLVNEFNGNDVGVFLISLKAGGTGLNLTGADIVIHYDPWWNVSAQNQASDRAYRIGQMRNVQVYKLIAKGTVEENIMRLQEEKARLGDIAEGGGEIAGMTAEEIVGLVNGE
ncbi:MAG: DEAD/DEAH box helicase [Ruminococcus sp.]|nr:DEAD/DEAH box helicase [Ruminococcus sp.]